MKNLIEHLTTMIVMMTLIFVFTIIITIGLQIVEARLVHTSTIEKLQSSYYNLSIEEINNEINNDWFFEINELSSVNSRRDYEVILNYSIKIPLFTENGLKGRLVGYAR